MFDVGRSVLGVGRLLAKTFGVEHSGFDV